MKLFFITQAIWMLIAIGAYIMGRGSAPSGPDGSNAANENGASRDAHRSLSWGDGSGNGPERATPGGGLREKEDTGVSILGDRGEYLGKALKESDPILRKQKLYALLANLNEEDVPSVLAAFEEAGKGDDIDGAFRDFLLVWGRMDGAAALEYALHNEDGRKVSYGSTTAMTGWASQDPVAAKEYLSSVEPGSTKQWLHYGIVKALVDSNLSEAIAFSAANTKSRARGRAMDLITSRLVDTEGPEGVKHWLDGIDPAGENDMNSYKSYAFRTALDRISRQNPELAAAWIAEASGQSYLDSGIMRSAAYRATEGNRVEALNWLTNIPESSQRREAITESVENLARDNPNEAAAWLNDQPLGPELDPALYTFSRTISESDPRAAVEWAGMIQNDRNRDKALVRAARNWIRREPDAARAWIDRQSFSEDSLRTILK